jgi:hypothetical protein
MTYCLRNGGDDVLPDLREHGRGQRNFPNWSMGFQNMDKVADLPGYDRYIQQSLTSKTFWDDSKGAYEFIVSFNELNR